MSTPGRPAHTGRDWRRPLVVALVATIALVATVALSGTTPAYAATALTRAFLDNLVPNVDFLDRSSRFALSNSKNGRLRDYARSEAREQTLAANAIDEWMEADKKAEPAISARNLDRTPTGSVTRTAQPGPVAAKDDRLPMGQEDLDSLEGLEGAEFDRLYKEKQLDALRQVETDYQDYIGRGDVPALKALAVRELPRIKRRLVQLGRL